MPAKLWYMVSGRKIKIYICLFTLTLLVLGSCMEVPDVETKISQQIALIEDNIYNPTGVADVLQDVGTIDKAISLVFLGSSDQDVMQRLLALLDKYNIKSTFFLPGISISQEPEIAQIIKNKGHEIGNYELDGGNHLDTLSLDNMVREFYRTQQILKDATDVYPNLFSCENTIYTTELLTAAHECGLKYAVQPTNYLNYLSFSSQTQAERFAEATNWGSIVAIKIQGQIEEEAAKPADQEMLSPAIDIEPKETASPLPEDEDERFLMVMEWLLKAYAEQGYNVLSPVALQGAKNTSLYEACSEPKSTTVKVMNNASTTQKAISLTFQTLGADEQMEKLLQTLDNRGIKASFFVTGEEAVERTALIKAIADKGHSIESGGFITSSKSMSYEEICADLQKSILAIEKATGVVPRMYRPLYGIINDEQIKACETLGLIPMQYNKNPLPEEGVSTNQVLKYFAGGFHRGDIVALRLDSYKKMNEIVDGIADILYDTGYKFVTAGELYDNQYKKKTSEEIENDGHIAMNADFNPKESVKGKYIEKIQVKSKVMFITFDDWGSDKTITKILTILDMYNVKASFFLIGSGVERNPNLARAIAENGHDVYSHTYAHSVMTSLSARKLQEDLVKCNQVLTSAIGVVPGPYYRPPTLEYSKESLNAATACGFKSAILANLSTEDYKGLPADELVEYVSANAAPGEIIVFHLTDHSTGVDALPGVIERLREKGYTLAKLSDYLDVEQ